MALVLSERDYKMVTLFSKIAGIFTFAAGTFSIFTKGEVLMGVVLLLIGTVVALAPIPMSVMKPDTLDGEEQDGVLTINE